MRKILPFLLIIAMLTGCNISEQCARRTIFCMDTVMDIQVWGSTGESAADAVVEMLMELEKTWSATDENSFLSALNRGEGTPNADQQALLDRAVKLHNDTGGAFDPKLGNVIALWGFYDDVYRVPTQEELAAAKTAPKWDLGAIVKGYASELAVEVLNRYDGIDRAILNFGGNVQTYRGKSNGDQWRIGIQNPKGGDSLGTLLISGSMAVVTSGDYQRYFEQDGVRYHHILDPETGMPATSGLSSVTIIYQYGATADALSTALFTMGLEKAVEFWRACTYYPFEAVFVLQDGSVYATEGVWLSGCEFEVICREN